MTTVPQEHERFSYSAIVDRKPLHWPNGARVAVWVIPNIEHFLFDRPSTSLAAVTTGLRPDILNASWIETPWLLALLCTCASMSGSNFTQGQLHVVAGIAALAIKNVIRQQPRLKLFRSSKNMRESPKEVSSRAAASGIRSRGAVSAARTICASFSRGSIDRSHSASIVSNVHSSPRWLQNTP